MDLSLLLNDYVKRESEEEKKFIKEQKQCNVKLRISVSHTNCLSTNEGTDLLMVHPKLTQTIDGTNNFFFIKSMKISHCTGVVQSNMGDNNKLMSIEIVISKDRCHCETIFKTFVNKDQDGKRNKFQMSYTRQIVKCRHSDGHHFEKNEFNTIFSDNENDGSENGLDSNLNATPPVDSLKNPTTKTKKKGFLKKSKNRDNFDIKNKKHKIPPGLFWKKKINPLENFVSKSELPKTVTPVLGTRKISIVRQFSMESENLEKEKPTNILAKICVSKKKDNYEFIKDDMAFIDEGNDDDNPDISDTQNSRDFYVRFDFCTVNDVEQEKYNTFESAECTCEERRLLAMYNFINSVIDKNPKLNNINEINKFNNETRHYSDCSRLSSHDSSGFLSPISLNSKFLSSSHNSVFFSSQRGSMSNILATPEFEMSKSRESSFRGSIDHFDKILQKLKTTEEVHCSFNHVNFFKNAKTYEIYKNTMRKSLANTTSLENLVVFLYSIRVIIQQIDHPCNSTNEDINRIFDFSNQFINEFFGSEVKRYGGLDNFIFRHDDVD